MIEYNAVEFRKLADDIFALDAGSMRDRARIIKRYLEPAYALRSAVAEAERLRALYEHALRCPDPEVCVDDTGPPETWRGCEENARIKNG